MAAIEASVGLGGVNDPDDVRRVQQLLNRAILDLGLAALIEDGDCARNTILAIQAYQLHAMRLRAADGRVDPDGMTWRALIADRRPPTAKPADDPLLSGAAWWDANQARFPNSARLADLASPFRARAGTFIDTLKAAGAQVNVAATLRHPARAKLMFHCWQVAKGACPPDAVPAIDGCAIHWDHGDPTRSRKAAQAMVDRFRIVFKPSAGTSRHTEGRAIDMSILWAGTIDLRDAQGKIHAIGAPRNGENNTLLHAVGKSYGVVKLLSDRPHWSDDGH